MNATYIQCLGCEKYDKYRSPIYEYEYRGHRYIVTDYRNGCSETMREQHHNEQTKIDEYEASKQKSHASHEDIDEVFKKLMSEWED